MTPSIQMARKKMKRKERLSTAAMIATIVAVVGGVSWAQYVMFDFAPPWVRVISISAAWVIVIGLVEYKLGFSDGKTG